MKLTKLTHIILELNAALDTGKYDKILVSQVSEQIEHKNVVPWLRVNVKEADLSLVGDEDVAVYHDQLAAINDGYAGEERRKWGVQNRGLCLLIAWTNEIVQQQVRNRDLEP